MILFLKIVGAFLVAFALFAAALYLLIRAKLRKFVRTLADSAEGLAAGSHFVQPMRIHLDSSDQFEWMDEDAVDVLAQPLLDQGFVEAGVYEADIGDGLTIRALVDRARSIHAAIYEVGAGPLGLDLVTRYADGTSVTYSNIKPHGMDSPPGKSIEFCQGLPADELLKRFLRERPDRQAMAVSAEQFVEAFEQYYAEEMDWRMERGGPTEEEIRRLADAEGGEITDEAVEQVQEMWSDNVSDFLEGRLRTSFLANSDLSALQWEEIRDRFTLVHDKLSPESVAELCDDYDEDDDDDDDDDAWEARQEEHRRLVRAKGPRAAFARWNKTASDLDRYQKIGQVSDPIDADVYLAPECDDDDYDDGYE